MGISCRQFLVLPLDTGAWMQVEPALEMIQAVELHRRVFFSCVNQEMSRAMETAEE